MYIIWDKIEKLGKIPDVELANKLNVSPQAIFQARKRRNISALNPAKKYDIDWDSVPLGKMIDKHIADIWGCSGSYVCQKRKKKNIPAFGMLYRTIENEAAYYGEAIIDAWLHKYNIEHKFQFQVGPYRIDWLICEDNEIWEFLGMWDHRIYGEQYQKNFVEKEKYLIEIGYKVKRIYKNKINTFKEEINLDKIHKASNFKCRGCGREGFKHCAKGLCGMCVSRLYNGQKLGPPKISLRLKNEDIFVCEDCGSEDRYKRIRNKCKSCYNKQYKRKSKNK